MSIECRRVVLFADGLYLVLNSIRALISIQLNGEETMGLLLTARALNVAANSGTAGLSHLIYCGQLGR